MKKFVLKALPYLVSISAGFIFYLLGELLQENTRGFFINISATFFAIPLIYLFYQLVDSFSHKKLNKEIFDYAKMQVDREILSILNQAYKIIYSLEEKEFSRKTINNLLSLKKEEIKKIVSKKEYLGFQIFKEWEVSENELHQILKNSYVLERLEDEQIIDIILVMKDLKHLEGIQRIKDLYLETNKKVNSYKVVSGTKINERNIKFPDRYLLLKNLGDNNFLVEDFGDFRPYNIEKLLHFFIVNKEFLEIYSDALFGLMKDINSWLDLTGREFVIDTRMFKLGQKISI